MRTQEPRAHLLAALVLLAAAGAAHAQTAASPPPVQWTKVSVDLPTSDAIFPAGEGAQIANAYCLMCHSEGMVVRQPPLAKAQWLEEIGKMRKFWGAPIPAAQDEALATYLARINGPGSPAAATR